MRSLILFVLAIACMCMCFQSADAGPIANLRARAGVSSSKTVVRQKTVAAPAVIQFQGYGYSHAHAAQAQARFSSGSYGGVTVFRGAVGHSHDVIEEEVIIRRSAAGSNANGYQSFQGNASGSCAPAPAAAFSDPYSSGIVTEKRTIRRSFRGAGGY